jgi:hypothetical protein
VVHHSVLPQHVAVAVAAVATRSIDRDCQSSKARALEVEPAS